MAVTPTEPPSDTSEAQEPTPVQSSAMRMAVACQCFYCLSWLAFTNNNLVLLYLQELGFDGPRILRYLSIVPLADGLLRIPFAFFGDRMRKKVPGVVGCLLNLVGFGLFTASAWMEGTTAAVFIFSGIVVYTIGTTMTASVWFALLSPIVPEFLRGRFFGRLRFSWQLTAFVFTIVCAMSLRKAKVDESGDLLGTFRIILLALLGTLVVRVFFYIRIPELERSTARGEPILVSVRKVLRVPGYASFVAYVFLLMLVMGGCPMLFGLVFSEVLGYSDDDVLWLMAVQMIGLVVGYFVGGKMVDRFGTKPVFLVCHFALAVVMFAFVLRVWLPDTVVWTALAVTLFGYGVTRAGSSIAISSEMLALIPAENKSLSTSVCQTLMHVGVGLSTLLPGFVIDQNMLSDSWLLMDRWELSSYDTILLFFGIMVVLLVVTLGLVPSVIGKSQWMPRMN